MPVRALVPLLAWLAAGCVAPATIPADIDAPPPTEVSEDAAGSPSEPGIAPGGDLGRALLRMDTAEEEAREALAYGPPEGDAFRRASARLDSLSRAHAERLRHMVREHGWPTEEMVGREASRAALFMAIRASHDPALQEEALRALRAAFDAGEADGESVAMLTDRMRLARGQGQLYGTQLILEDFDVHLRPIEDEENVDRRRAALGLMPLAEYVALVRSMFGMREP